MYFLNLIVLRIIKGRTCLPIENKCRYISSDIESFPFIYRILLTSTQHNLVLYCPRRTHHDGKHSRVNIVLGDCNFKVQ